MPTYLYCLLGRGNEPPRGLAGVGGAAVRGLDASSFTAWVSRVEGQPRASVSELEAHDVVTRAALETGETPVPFRFGQVFPGDEACVRALEERAAGLLRALDRVAGCVEMSVLVRLERPTVGESDPAHGDAGSGAGRAYMERLRGRSDLERIVRGEARSARHRLSGIAAPFVRGEGAVISIAPPSLTLSHLVPRERLQPYLPALSGVGQERGRRSLVIRGPSAPYSFVAADEP